MLRKIRIGAALTVLLMFVCLFSSFSADSLAVKYFGWLPKIQFAEACLSFSLAALVWIALTFLLGRVYCSAVCPLGIMQDCAGFFIYKKRRDKNYEEKDVRSWKKFRLILLAVYIFAFAAGIHCIFTTLSPYALFGRFMDEIINPLAVLVNNLLLRAVGEHLGLVPVKISVFSIFSFCTALIGTAAVLGTVFIHKRFWCTKICPVGTCLELISKNSPAVISADGDKCIKCGKCSRICRAGCIDNEINIDNSACLKCFDCIEFCPKHALKIGLKRSAENKK